MLWLPSGLLTAPALFLAGSAASAHCALMCGGLTIQHARASGTLSARTALLWLHGGRIGGYAAMGALAGAIGQTIFRHLALPQLGYALQLAAALSLLASGAWMTFFRSRQPRHGGNCCPVAPALSAQWPARLAQLLRGLLWALLPCGLLYSVLLLAAFSGNAVEGALLTAAFALGGTPALAAIGWRFGRRSSAVSATRSAGVWMMLFAALCLLTLAWSGAGGNLAWCAGVVS